MKKSTPFSVLLQRFEKAQRQFGNDANRQTLSALQQLQLCKLDNPKLFQRYADALLFTVAYPGSEDIAFAAEGEMDRLFRACEKWSGKKGAEALYNSALPGTEVCATYSLTHNEWLLNRYGKSVSLYEEDLNTEEIIQHLQHGLDPVEQEVYNEGLDDWDTWKNEIAGFKEDAHRTLDFLVGQTALLKGTLGWKESLFSSFHTFTNWQTKKDDPLFYGARIHFSPSFIHRSGILKKMTIGEALEQGQPKAIKLNPEDRNKLVDIGKAVLGSLMRETDPITYAQVQETEYFDMGRGVGIALYYMVPEMKMTLQSYVGYLLFKNGAPCAYGGGWLFNNESGFGVNIFPPYRGGESANIVCQLLRLYALHFNANTFTVDPYQIGLGNPEGIQSGSFWFYYRLGFRPEQPELRKLAESEFKKIGAKTDYRSNEKILLKLAHSTMRWTHPHRKEKKFLSAEKIAEKTRNHINKKHQGDRGKATVSALIKIRENTGRDHFNPLAAKIATTLDAAGLLDKTDPEILNEFLEAYRLKSQYEREYILASQEFPEIFEPLKR